MPVFIGAFKESDQMSPSSSHKVSQAQSLRLSLLWHQAKAAELAYRQALDELLPAEPVESPRAAEAPATAAEAPLPRVHGIPDVTGIDTIYQIRHIHLPGVPVPTIDVHRKPILGTLTRRPLAHLDEVLPIARAIYAHLDDDQEHFAFLACDSHGRAFACKVVHTGLHATVDVDPGLFGDNYSCRSTTTRTAGADELYPSWDAGAKESQRGQRRTSTAAQEQNDTRQEPRNGCGGSRDECALGAQVADGAAAVADQEETKLADSQGPVRRGLANQNRAAA